MRELNITIYNQNKQFWFEYDSLGYIQSVGYGNTIDINLITENTRSCFYLPDIFILN